MNAAQLSESKVGNTNDNTTETRPTLSYLKLNYENFRITPGKTTYEYDPDYNLIFSNGDGDILTIDKSDIVGPTSKVSVRKNNAIYLEKEYELYLDESTHTVLTMIDPMLAHDNNTNYWPHGSDDYFVPDHSQPINNAVKSAFNKNDVLTIAFNDGDDSQPVYLFAMLIHTITSKSLSYQIVNTQCCFTCVFVMLFS